MPFGPLIDCQALAGRLGDASCCVVDARFSLADPSQGERDYIYRHIPGALYAHLDRDLSGPIVPGRTGRHPLPDPDRLAATFGAWGIDAATQVVAYDGMGGALAAARLWWLLRWLGHEAVAVLDGGWAAWESEGRPTRAGRETQPPRRFVAQLRPELVVDATKVDAMRLDPAARLLDARGADRFRGENETIDPVAGHIPGARSAPFADNLGADGRFRPPAALRAHYAALLGSVSPERTAVYCGSGVTAAHDLLAMAQAGLDGARLYAGSWSEWITDPGRAVAAGDGG